VTEMSWKAPSLAEILNGERSIAEMWNGERRPYTGVLAEPIPDTEDFVEIVCSERLQALCEHYGIDMGPGMWVRLVWELARAHVPGFQATETKKRGRRSIDFDTLANVVRDVNALKVEGHSQQRAFELLAARYGISPAGVRSRYEMPEKKLKEIKDQIREWLARERQQRETGAPAAIQPRTAEELRRDTQRMEAMKAAVLRDLKVIEKVVERQRDMDGGKKLGENSASKRPNYSQRRGPFMVLYGRPPKTMRWSKDGQHHHEAGPTPARRSPGTH
jgi:hypothetical protein